MKFFGIRIGDIIIFTLCLTGLLIGYGLSSTGLFSSDSSNNLMVKVSSSRGEWIYPLDKELELDVEGPIGSTHIHIDSGHARISESPCKDKLCIKAGEISSINTWAACLPNKIFIQIIGTDNKEVIDDLSF